MLDNDPGPEETGRGGITYAVMADDASSEATVPKGSEGSILFLETVRDSGGLLPIVSAPHEVGHQFGLKGDATGFGLMSVEGTTFVDRHLNVLRWRVKSPGQP